MAWKIGDRGFVQASSCVDIYGIGDVLGWLYCFADGRVQGLVLSSRGE